MVASQFQNKLLTLRQQLLSIKNQDKLISHLQVHDSFVCQSENINDYLAEIELLANHLSQFKHRDSPGFSIIEDKFINQYSLLFKLASGQAKTKQLQTIEGKERSSWLHTQYEKLAKYRQYQQQFEDSLRQMNAQGDNSSQQYCQLYQRRENCLKAIVQLEEKITNKEKNTNTRRT